MFSCSLDSTKPHALPLAGRASSRNPASDEANRPASRRCEFFFPFRREGCRYLAIGIKDHFKGIPEILAGFIHRAALSHNARNLFNPCGNPSAINILERCS